TKARAFQKHEAVALEVTPRKGRHRVEAGSFVVRGAQPLGNLAAFLLEPAPPDGLAAWNFFDNRLKEGDDFPVRRLPEKVALTTGRPRPLPEDRPPQKKSINFDTFYGNAPPPNFSGTPVSILGWLDDGEHFLQVKAGRLHKVDALTGRSQPFFDPDKLAAGLATLPALDKETAQQMARSPVLQMNPARTAALFVYENDLYHCNLDGTKPVRLT